MGGRGSKGKSKGGGGSGSSGPENFKPGTYVDEDGQEYTVTYKSANGRIAMYVDGQEVGPSARKMTEGQNSGKWMSTNAYGNRSYHKSKQAAEKEAFGSPKDYGWKKKK